MRKIRISLFSILLLSQPSFAADSSLTHLVVAPSCLLKQSKIESTTLASYNDYLLISTAQKSVLHLANLHAEKSCGDFVDVTPDWLSMSSHNAKAALQLLKRTVNHTPKLNTFKPVHYQIQYTHEVNQLMGQMNPQNMWDKLTALSGFYDRHANSDNGVKAAHWLRDEMKNLVSTYQRNDVSFTFVATGTDFKQPSLVVKMGTSNEPGIVIGAHMDTRSEEHTSIAPEPSAP